MIYNANRKDKHFNIKGGDTMRYSVNWITWRAIIKPTTCPECFTRNGRIYSFDDLIRISVGIEDIEDLIEDFRQAVDSVENL